MGRTRRAADEGRAAARHTLEWQGRRKIQHFYCKTLYKQRHRIENMFGRIKDWRRIAMRYDRCAHAFFSAICITATICFYLNQ